MLDHRLGKGYLSGGTMIPDSDGEINIRARELGDVMVVVVSKNQVFWDVGVSYGRNT